MIDCLPCSKLFSRLTSQMVKRGKPPGAPGYRNVQYDTLNTPSGWNNSSHSPSPVSAVCTSCTRWHERWRWRGSPCSHWCHSPWWCTGPGADRRWLPPCLAWDRGRQRDKRRGVKGNNCSTLSCRWERNPDDTKTGTSPKKTTVTSPTSCTQIWVEQHSFIVFATLVSCFGSSGKVCERERGGKLFIWGRRGPLWGMWFRP